MFNTGISFAYWHSLRYTLMATLRNMNTVLLNSEKCVSALPVIQDLRIRETVKDLNVMNDYIKHQRCKCDNGLGFHSSRLSNTVNLMEKNNSTKTQRLRLQSKQLSIINLQSQHTPTWLKDWCKM